MSATQKLLATLGVALAALTIGGVVGWFAAGPPSTGVQIDPRVKSEARIPLSSNLATVRTNVQPAGTNRTRSTIQKTRSQRIGAKTNQVAAAKAPSTGAGSEEWEGKLDAILTAETDDLQKAKKIVEMFPKLPEEGQEEAAEHLANLLPDDHYDAARQLLTNVKSSELVLDALMSDLLNRPNTLKLPVLLEMARAPEHPRGEEAKEFLELYLEKDYGANWAEWEQAMKAWLKENPE